jgi:hypothetical protein
VILKPHFTLYHNGLWLEFWDGAEHGLGLLSHEMPLCTIPHRSFRAKRLLPKIHWYSASLIGFWEATRATVPFSAGMTMSKGRLLEASVHCGGGVWISVPSVSIGTGGLTESCSIDATTASAICHIHVSEAQLICSISIYFTTSVDGFTALFDSAEAWAPLAQFSRHNRPRG